MGSREVLWCKIPVRVTISTSPKWSYTMVSPNYYWNPHNFLIKRGMFDWICRNFIRSLRTCIGSRLSTMGSKEVPGSKIFVHFICLISRERFTAELSPEHCWNPHELIIKIGMLDLIMELCAYDFQSCF